MLLSFSYEIPSLGFLRQFYGYVLIMARGFVDLVPVFFCCFFYSVVALYRYHFTASMDRRNNYNYQ